MPRASVQSFRRRAGSRRCPRLPLLRRADQDPLRIVPRALAGDAGGPEAHRLIEHAAVPPIGVAAGQVDRPLEAAGDGLAELVAGHEQALVVLGAGAWNSRCLVYGR
jgi:hypothetical protein